MQGSDNRLGISIAASGGEQTAAQVQTLTAQLKSLNAEIARVGASTSGVAASSGNYVNILRSEAAAVQGQLQALRASLGITNDVTAATKANTVAISENAQAIIRQMEVADAAAALHARNASRIITAQRALSTQPVERGVGQFLSSAQMIQSQRAVSRMQTQQRPTAPPVGATAGHFLNSAELIKARQAADDLVANMFALQRAETEAAVAGETVSGALRGVASSSTVATREAGHLVAIFDGLERGQSRQAIASIGSSMRDAGLGNAGLLAGVGGLVAVMGSVAILRGAENMSKWANQVKNASAAVGMSVPQYSQLQGALELSGVKATAADASLRMFAENLEKAAANPASNSAKALHALGISQDEIRSKSADTMAMLLRVSDALKNHAQNSNSAAAAAELFGRSDENLFAALLKGSDGLQTQMRAAQALGITLTDQTAAALTLTGEKINDLTADIRGGSIQAFIEWAPAIGRAADALHEIVDAMRQASAGLSALDNMLSASGGIFGAFASAIAPAVGLLLSVRGMLKGSQLNMGRDPHDPGSNVTLPDVSVSASRGALPGVQPFNTKAGGGGANKETTSDIDALRKSLQGLRADYQMVGEEADAAFTHARLAAKLAAADKDISPRKAAEEDYAAYAQAGAQKIAALQAFKAASDSTYDQIIAKAQEVYTKDPKLYKEAIQEKINADKEFAVQAMKLQDEVAAHQLEVINAYKSEVQAVVQKWGSAFDDIGDHIESTIEAAIKLAFNPQQAQYWWSTMSGPKGQPLMVPHRIDPTTSLLENLGGSIAQDLGKTLLSSIGTSISKSIFGEGTASFGAGLAKMIGIGGPGGLFGTGLGAVKALTGSSEGGGIGGESLQVGATTANTTAITALTTALAANTAALGTASASSGASALSTGASTAGGLGGAFGFIKSLFFSSGGIVPAAAGGWSVPRSFGTDSIHAMLTPGETVLPPGERPSNITKALQGTNSGDMHLHFHGPADGPSIDRWFKNMMSSNPGVVKNFFRQNALSPRTF
jgi:hypothetical protein